MASIAMAHDIARGNLLVDETVKTLVSLLLQNDKKLTEVGTWKPSGRQN